MLLGPLKYLIFSFSFWAVVITLVWLLVRLLRTRISLKETFSFQVSALPIKFKVFVTFMSLVTAGMIFFATYMNYGAPWDIMQDVVSAQEILNGRTPYPENLRPLIQLSLQREPPEISLGRYWPRLRDKERSETGGFLSRQVHTPPQILLFMILVPLLGVHKSCLVFDLMSIGGLLLSLALIHRGLVPKLSGFLAAACTFAVLGWAPVINCLRQGQSGLLIGTLLVCGWYLLRKDRQLVAGVLIGLATALKLYPGLLFIYFLLRYRRALIAGIVTVLILCIICGFVMGWQVFFEYLDSVPYVSRIYGGNPLNYSLLALLRKNSLDTSFQQYVIIACFPIGYLAWLVIHRLNQHRENLDIEYSAFVALMLLLPPTTWSHYLLPIVLPFVVLLKGLLVGCRPAPIVTFLALLLVFTVPVGTVICLANAISSPLPFLAKFLQFLPNLALLACCIWMFWKCASTREQVITE
jgi:hypothetical protein